MLVVYVKQGFGLVIVLCSVSMDSVVCASCIWGLLFKFRGAIGVDSVWMIGI